jgi:hypothetical protein
MKPAKIKDAFAMPLRVRIAGSIRPCPLHLITAGADQSGCHCSSGFSAPGLSSSAQHPPRVNAKLTIIRKNPATSLL